MLKTIAFTVNGRAAEVVQPHEDTPLLDVLRNKLRLVGTRFGCGLEQCGCCIVLIDGKPVKSRGRPAASVAGCNVTTIEGLGTPDKPHPLQQALLVEKGLLQRMWLVRRSKTFDRRHVAAGDACGGAAAGLHRLAVDQHDAAAALFKAATKPRPNEPQFIAQHVEQRRVFVRQNDLGRTAVDGESDGLKHRPLCAASIRTNQENVKASW